MTLMNQQILKLLVLLLTTSSFYNSVQSAATEQQPPKLPPRRTPPNLPPRSTNINIPLQDNIKSTTPQNNALESHIRTVAHHTASKNMHSALSNEHFNPYFIAGFEAGSERPMSVLQRWGKKAELFGKRYLVSKGSAENEAHIAKLQGMLLGDSLRLNGDKGSISNGVGKHSSSDAVGSFVKHYNEKQDGFRDAWQKVAKAQSKYQNAFQTYSQTPWLDKSPLPTNSPTNTKLKLIAQRITAKPGAALKALKAWLALHHSKWTFNTLVKSVSVGKTNRLLYEQSKSTIRPGYFENQKRFRRTAVAATAVAATLGFVGARMASESGKDNTEMSGQQQEDSTNQLTKHTHHQHQKKHHQQDQLEFQQQ